MKLEQLLAPTNNARFFFENAHAHLIDITEHDSHNVLHYIDYMIIK